jgi:hypothetical protein
VSTPEADQQIGALPVANESGNLAAADGSDPVGRNREHPYPSWGPAREQHTGAPHDGTELAQPDARAVAGERDFEGIGVTVRCSLNRVTFRWANDSLLTLKFDQVASKVDCQRLPEQGVIKLTLAARMDMDVPHGLVNGVNIVLAFSGSDAAKVESLAERLRSMAAATSRDGGSASGGARSAPPQAGAVESRSGAPQSRPGAAESRAKTADSKVPASPPGPVRVRAGLASWADEENWLVLYPTKETERLLLASPSSQADRQQGT